MLRFEAIVHNTRALHTGRMLEKFPDITTRLAEMVDRFTTMLDCVDVGFLPDGILDQLPPGPRPGQPESAASTSTSPAPVQCWPPCLPWLSRPTIHPGRPRREGALTDRPRGTGIHRPPGRLRSAETAR